ncbi:MAG TPA: hypothetical protein VGS27_28390 [Candidatus Sulfotelmatobacter sp.]|nr:hypothetical protein [Candidatus Sulfotelmatobacter sp.]
MVLTVKPVQLSSNTLEAFNAYIHNAELHMQQSLHRGEGFLWSEQAPGQSQAVDQGQVVAQFWSGEGPVKVPHGLIHDWIAAAFIPDSKIQDVLAVMQDYDHHKNTYKPEVIDSKLIARDGNDFQVYLRLLKKKIITVILDTDHEVHYSPVDKMRWVCHSYTTRIAEVENAGSPDERVLPPETGYGFLWRLYSYWRFEERNAGVVFECRAISLTRDVPFGLGWAIEPIIEKLPKESLINTLESTREAFQANASSESPG